MGSTEEADATAGVDELSRVKGANLAGVESEEAPGSKEGFNA